MKARRPNSIRWFEWAQYAIFGLGILNTVMTFDRQPDLVSAGPAFVAIMALVGAAFLLLFVWLIAYRGSTIAKWIFVGLNALGLLVLVDLRQILEREGATSVGIILIQSAAQLVALWMLFRRDARDWFAGRRPIDPAVFD